MKLENNISPPPPPPPPLPPHFQVRTSADFTTRAAEIARVIIADQFKSLKDRVHHPVERIVSKNKRSGNVNNANARHAFAAHRNGDGAGDDTSAHHRCRRLNKYIVGDIRFTLSDPDYRGMEDTGTIIPLPSPFLPMNLSSTSPPYSAASPFAGSFEVANKAAGNDLRGAVALFHVANNADVLEDDEYSLGVAQRCLVDYLGFRCLATALIDCDRRDREVNEDTLEPASLKVGSMNVVRTLPHGERSTMESDLNYRLSKFAAALGLAPHTVVTQGGEQGGTAFAESIEMHVGADVTCHVDRWRRASVVSASRVLPPECPIVTTSMRSRRHVLDGSRDANGDGDGDENSGNSNDDGKAPLSCPLSPNVSGLLTAVGGNRSIYWRQLRPELLQQWQSYHSGNQRRRKEEKTVDIGKDIDALLGNGMLSSDAYSQFVTGARDEVMHNTRVEHATRFMLEKQVEKVAREILGQSPEDKTPLVSVFHRCGVNMRHAGAVLRWIEWEEMDTQRQRAVEMASTSHTRGGGGCGGGSSKDSVGGGHDAATSARYRTAKTKVVGEMVARTSKQMVRRNLRHGLSCGATESDHRRIVVAVLSCVTGSGECDSAEGGGERGARSGGSGGGNGCGENSGTHSGGGRTDSGESRSSKYWKALWRGLEDRFGVCVRSKDRNFHTTARGADPCHGLVPLVRRLCSDTGVWLTSQCKEDLQRFARDLNEYDYEAAAAETAIATAAANRGGGTGSGGTGPLSPSFTFVEADIGGIREVVTSMNIEDSEQGRVLRDAAGIRTHLNIDDIRTHLTAPTGMLLRLLGQCNAKLTAAHCAHWRTEVEPNDGGGGNSRSGKGGGNGGNGSGGNVEECCEDIADVRVRWMRAICTDEVSRCNSKEGKAAVQQQLENVQAFAIIATLENLDTRHRMSVQLFDMLCKARFGAFAWHCVKIYLLPRAEREGYALRLMDSLLENNYYYDPVRLHAMAVLCANYTRRSPARGGGTGMVGDDNSTMESAGGVPAGEDDDLLTEEGAQDGNKDGGDSDDSDDSDSDDDAAGGGRGDGSGNRDRKQPPHEDLVGASLMALIREAEWLAFRKGDVVKAGQSGRVGTIVADRGTGAYVVSFEEQDPRKIERERRARAKKAEVAGGKKGEGSGDASSSAVKGDEYWEGTPLLSDLDDRKGKKSFRRREDRQEAGKVVLLQFPVTFSRNTTRREWTRRLSRLVTMPREKAVRVFVEAVRTGDHRQLSHTCRNVDIDMVAHHAASAATQTTALWRACWDGFHDVVGMLIEASAAVNFPDARGRTPLYAAALQARFKVTVILLQVSAYVYVL
jgi:hypothetical protein